jgi:hypothetical protein
VRCIEGIRVVLRKGVPLKKDDSGIETTMGLEWLMTGIGPRMKIKTGNYATTTEQGT